MENSEKVTIELKPYLTKELIKFYQVTYPTFAKWMKGIEDKVGKRVGAYWSVKQVEIIFKELGMPKTYSF
ncbi:MAG: hypothetical protein JST26_11245 [Bacteroidetes bacterium]|nr:hypothetical protein [Bacteroidia bacterium]MBS1636480.1 hypothetical protein [Bacteroidota bacterium]